MAPKPLTDEQCRETYEAVKHYGSIMGASRALGLARSTIQARYEVARLRFDAEEIRNPNVLRPSAMPVQDQSPESKGWPFERAWGEICHYIGMAKERYRGPASRPTGKRIKLVAAGDFHIPFHSREAVARLIQQDGDADVLVIGGDFGDAHCASTFTKYEHVPFHEEFAGQAAILQLYSETFPVVRYLRDSNHPGRFEKRLREALTKDVLDAVLEMTGGILNPDMALIKRYPNVTLLDLTTPAGHSVGWLGGIGDVLFSHAEKYSRVPGAALRSVEEWIADFSGHLGIDDYRAIVQFHTHATALLPWRSDKLLIEPGCMCAVHSYQMRSKIAGRPQRLGYAVMELEDGKLDVNSVRLRMLDADSHAA